MKVKEGKLLRFFLVAILLMGAFTAGAQTVTKQFRNATVPEYVFLDKYGNYYSKKYGWTTDALLDAGLNTSNSYDNVLSDVLQKPGDVLRMYTRYFTIEPWSHDVILETTDDREYCLPTLLSSEGCYPSDEADTIASYYQLVKDGIITPKTNSEIKKRFDDWADTAVGL